jgi:hypothetical protein
LSVVRDASFSHSDLASKRTLNMHWLDPDHLPHVTANVERFLLNPHGDVDGMILTNGIEVHSPPHLSDEIRARIRPGDRVTVHGVRPRSADMIAAVAIDAADGKRILDNGPPKDHKKGKKLVRDEAPNARHRKMEAAGSVVRALHGPKGEIRGCLLDTGTIVRFPAHEAGSIVELLPPGAPLAVRGEGLETEFGTVIEAKEIGASKDATRSIKSNKPKHDTPPKDGAKHNGRAHT